MTVVVQISYVHVLGGLQGYVYYPYFLARNIFLLLYFKIPITKTHSLSYIVAKDP